jgi:hypothetical protein
MRTLALVALLAGCNGVVPQPGPTPSPTAFPRLWSGATLYATQSHQFPFIVKGKPQIDSAELDAIAAAGFTAVRLTVVPAWTPRNRDQTFNFTGVDALYAACIARSLRPLFMAADPATASDVATMTEYLREAAPRYPSAYLELGNEPDTPSQWHDGPITPAQYWADVKPWLQAWRSGEPKGSVATGATSGMNLPWQKALVAAIVADLQATGYDGFADLAAFGAHPYGEWLIQPPGVVGGGFGDDMVALQKVVAPYGLTVWLTEYGLPNAQPSDVNAWLGAAQTMGVPLFSWYEIRDNAAPYGLLKGDLSHKSPDPYAAAQAFLVPTPKPST